VLVAITPLAAIITSLDDMLVAVTPLEVKITSLEIVLDFVILQETGISI
jgi:hypothetical protein